MNGGWWSREASGIDMLTKFGQYGDNYLIVITDNL